LFLTGGLTQRGGGGKTHSAKNGTLSFEEFKEFEDVTSQNTQIIQINVIATSWCFEQT
jgi:hypothetical protein